METTQTLRFKTKALAVLSKCYDHAQTHLKGGVLQVNLLSVNYGGPGWPPWPTQARPG